MWLLTRSVNDYRQHGEYFCAVWKNKPSDFEIVNWAKGADQYIDLHRAKTIIDGGDSCDGWDRFYLGEIGYE